MEIGLTCFISTDSPPQSDDSLSQTGESVFSKLCREGEFPNLNQTSPLVETAHIDSRPQLMLCINSPSRFPMSGAIHFTPRGEFDVI